MVGIGDRLPQQLYEVGNHTDFYIFSLYVPFEPEFRRFEDTDSVPLQSYGTLSVAGETTSSFRRYECLPFHSDYV